MRFIITMFILLHGWVHVWYLLLAGNIVKYTPDMGWSGQSWLLTGWLGESFPRQVAVFLYLIAAVLFTATGIGYNLGKSWFINMMLISTVFSSLLIIAFFDGKFELLVQKGLVGLIINIILLMWVVVAKPS
ncbi:MAG: hypothetical protein K9G67_14450 [Bacteroidales bacterium]|nr:hypothetical protein [Bacteroidales bacterium]MCF8377555.1 hypothetical protein [Bacteroidales bacterium]MCF8401779.1 hypothetical protein [Bacteroidales bacterium]